MKKVSRLTALLLALLLIFQMTAVATETESSGNVYSAAPIAREDLDAQTIEQMSEAAEVAAAANVVRGFGIVKEDCGLYYPNLENLDFARIAKDTIVAVYEGEFRLLFGVLGTYYKVAYNGRDGYILTSHVNLCACETAEGAGLADHLDTCPDKMYYISVCALNAETIYANWANYTEATQAFILYYLEKNDAGKLAALQELIDPKLEIVYDPWDGTEYFIDLAFSVEDAVAYKWERGLIQSDGTVSWEEGAIGTSAELTIKTYVDNMKYVYRCTALNESGESIGKSEELLLVREDIAQWITDSETEVTYSMLTRAVRTKSLESLSLEKDKLVYVRTGETIAVFNRANNSIIDPETGELLGFIIDGVVYTPAE